MIPIRITITVDKSQSGPIIQKLEQLGLHPTIEPAKPDNCTCKYPDAMYANGSGHSEWCPCHNEITGMVGEPE